MRFELPFPPTVNTIWRTSSYHGQQRTTLSAKGRAYRKAVQQCVFMDGFMHRMRLSGRLGMTITLHAPDKRCRDIDNYSKAILDAFTHAGVWDDDEQIDYLLIERGENRKAGLAVVEVRPIEYYQAPREQDNA